MPETDPEGLSTEEIALYRETRDKTLELLVNTHKEVQKLFDRYYDECPNGPTFCLDIRFERESR